MGRAGDGFWCQILNCPWRRNTDSALPHDTPSNLSFSITIRTPHTVLDILPALILYPSSFRDKKRGCEVASPPSFELVPSQQRR